MKTTIIHSLTLRWLSRQTPELIDIMREFWANELRVPKREVNSTFREPGELDWVWRGFEMEIRELSGCNLSKDELAKARVFFELAKGARF